jgi:hypothetical protein
MIQSIRPSVKSKTILFLRPIWGIAAALLIIGTLALYLYRSKEISGTAHATVKSTIDHAPGGNRAVLILGNGTRVLLDAAPNGTIAKQTGVRITKTAEGQLIYTLQNIESSANNQLSYNTIETPKGGQYQITMPDGTKVWLNAQSSLKYPTYFNSKERRVELSGEAYFEVKHQESSPFRVVINDQLIEVLGTHFNVNSYADEPAIKTTLMEGSVKLSFKNNPGIAVLNPGQQSVYEDNKFQIKQVDTEESIAWKKGYFAFNKSSLEDIMRQISRWYNVEVSYQQNSLKKELFSGNVSRFEKASQVLSILELTGLVSFKIEERRITVMP